MAKTTGDIIVERLIDWGVDTVFGLPGDGINGIFEALRVNQDKIRFIQCRHEEAAAFAACGYAKFTGRLGVCFATSGPGAIHLLNGLYDAKLDHAPVLAITGHTFHDMLGMQYQQEIDILTAVQGRGRLQPDDPRRPARPAVDRRRLPLGADSQGGRAPDLPGRHPGLDGRRGPEVEKMKPGHTSDAWRPPIVVPQRSRSRPPPRSSTPARRSSILAGQGARGAGDELEKVAETLGAPIIKALLGKAVVPDDSPYTTGGIGLLGTLPSEKAMEDCDTLFMVGTSFPYLKWYPKPGQAKAVQIDIDPSRIGLRYPVEIGLTGDAGATLQALLPLLKRKDDRSFLEKVMAYRKEWDELMQTPRSCDDTPVKPQVVARHVNDLLADDAIVTTDSGTITTWAARHIQMREGMMFSLLGQPGDDGPGPALRDRRRRRPTPAARSSRSSATAGSRC